MSIMSSASRIESLESRRLLDGAPYAVQGVTYRCVITDNHGSGPTSGSFLIEYTTDSAYTSHNETPELGDDSSGTYTWRRRSDGSGLFAFDDTLSGVGQISFNGDGTYDFSLRNNAGAYVLTQEGNFELSDSIDFVNLNGGNPIVSGNDFVDDIEINDAGIDIQILRNGFEVLLARADLATGAKLQINTAGGNDFIRAGGLTTNGINASAGSGDDTVQGSQQDDSINGNSGRGYVIGNNGNDRLRGSNGRDLLFGGGGEDRLYGVGGNDVLDGGGGRNRLYGGDGDDLLIGGGSNDRLYGEAGNDILFGKAGNDVLNGGDGTDTRDAVGNDLVIDIP